MKESFSLIASIGRCGHYDLNMANTLKNVKCINYMPLGVIHFEDIPVGEFMYLVFTRMPGESYRRRLRSLLLCFSDVFRALINPLVLMRQVFV